MRIIGIGVDIVETSRIASSIERLGEKFLDRVFTPDEQRYCGGHRAPEASYAARFAAKEAVSKAFGTGMGPHVSWLDIEVQRNADGKPTILLRGQGEAYARELGVTDVLVSLSHSEHYAVAHVVACGA